MTNEEFKKLADELLVGGWGAQNYPAAQISRLWAIIRDIGPGDFRSAMDQLALTVNRAPSLAQIRATCLPAINRAIQAKRLSAVKALGARGCEYCGGTGWLNAIPYENPNIEVSFICTKCECANLIGGGIKPEKANAPNARVAYWSDARESEFFPRRAGSSEDLIEAVKMQRAANADLYKKPADRRARKLATEFAQSLGIESAAELATRRLQLGPGSIELGPDEYSPTSAI